MFAAVASYAQQAVGTWTIQPKVGMTIADLSGDNVKLDSKVGFIGGAELEYQATDLVSISAGAVYSMQGAKVGDLKCNLDYINVPILANVYVAKGLAVKLGAQVGFNVNSEFKYDTGIAGNYPLNFKANTVDFSIPVGISYEYQNFVIDGRYNLGVTKVAKDWDAKNSVFQVTLGYKFAL